MTKLSKAQEAILNEAKKNIDEARSYKTYEEYAYNTSYRFYSRFSSFEEAIQEIREDSLYDIGIELYEELKSGIAFIKANTRTIEKLEEMGLIEIVRIGGSRYDRIKILNY